MGTFLVAVKIFMDKRFSKEEIEILSKNPNVKDVRDNRLILTFDFRLKLFEEWEDDRSTACIKRILTENGFDCTIIGHKKISKIHETFKYKGRPTGARNKVFGTNSFNNKTDKSDNEFLISTGKFKKAGNGIQITDEFLNDIYHQYPSRSVEEILEDNGIDPHMVGYQRIYRIKSLLDEGSCASLSVSYSEETIHRYSSHPYVKRITNKHFVLNDHFYNEASIFKDMHIDDILDIFEIDHTLLNPGIKNSIKYKLKKWEMKDLPDIACDSPVYLLILRNKSSACERIIHDEFDLMKEMIPLITKKEKKALCEWIRDFNVNGIRLPASLLCRKLGISRSNYYHILKSEHFGEHEENKEKSDEEDVKAIREVMDSDPYPMGSRMIYMKMKDITGKQFGLRKIRRLMNKFNLKCTLRSPKNSNKAARELLKRNRKPNLLKRKFRFNRPLTTFLSDVSYLTYGNNLKAYLSPVKDAVTGRIMGACVSDANDLNLACDTLTILEDVEIGDNPLFHTDQGSVYLSDSFQNMVIGLGLTQSMSRRGNCWDNASQESFFGHFKDECDYRNCRNLEELRKTVEDYIDYYNNRRPQWTRNKMTPVQFEKYLLDMDDTEFNAYRAKVKEQYDIMIKSAREKAVKRARDIGALEED